MKKLLIVLAVLGMAAAIGYLLGTENGRAQRDQAIAKIKQAKSGGSSLDDPLADLRDETRDAVEEMTAAIETA